MSINVRMVFKAIVKPFYRQYAVLFAFILFILFFAVGRANQAGLLEYHVALMKGILFNAKFLVLVLVAWLLYNLKCQQFITRTLRAKEYRFLSQLAYLHSGRIFWLMLLTQAMLLLPVLIYACMLVWIGFRLPQRGPAMIITFFLLVICMAGATHSTYLVRHPGKKEFSGQRIAWFGRRAPYWNFFIRFILEERKLLFTGIKLYSAGTLYFMLVEADFNDHTDLQLVYLFYSFGLLGHGVLIHQLRTMEDLRLGFYRSLPVSLVNRWLQYGCLYILVFSPEILIIIRNASKFPNAGGAFTMAFFGYGVLLLLNSLLFTQHFKMADWLKIVTGIFFLVYIAVLTELVGVFTFVVFIIGAIVFFSRYYQYERWDEVMD